jgi:O-antigen ligase
VLLFIAATTILALVLGGQGVKHGRSDRLAAEEFAMMGNPNSVAYICGFLCVTLLFWSLRSAKSFRPILWLLSAVLAYFTFRSVSRVGIVILGFGLLMLLITILSARGARTGGLVMLLIAFVALWQFAFMFSESFDMLERRLGSERRNTESRTKLYNLSTLGDLASATPFGFGPRGSTLTSTGITAHNTFVYTYMAYGAIAAWPYLIWVIILGVRVVRLMRARDLPADTRLMVFTLFSMIMAEHLTNNVGFAEITAVVGTAVVDKYTRPYSARAMAQRELEGMEELPAYSDGRPAVQYY